MNSNLSRGHFLAAASSAAMIPQILAKPDPGKMKAGTAKVDITPDRPRYTLPGAYTGHPEALLLDPPSVYHPVHARCLTLYDGARRMVFVTYDGFRVLRRTLRREISRFNPT